MTWVAVLGRTEVVLDNAENAASLLLRPRERALIAALALRRPSAVAADDLISMMWVDKAPATARQSLQNHVARVRKAGGSDLVVFADARYLLGPGVVTDIDQVESLVREGRVAERERRWEGRVQLGKDCLQLRRGEPYADLPETAEVKGERNRLQEVLSQVEENVTETLLLMGHHQEAISRLERMVSEEPFRERRWEQLLAARFLVGNRRAALQVAAAAATALAEVGLAPGGRLSRLEGLGLVDDHHGLIGEVTGPHRAEPDAPAPVAGDFPPPGGLRPPDHMAPFVGRVLELGRLADAFGRSLRAEVGPVLVCGEAGIGKTTLVRRFIEDLAGSGVRVAWAAGAANPRAPLAAWVEVVKQLLRADRTAIDRLGPADRLAINALLQGRAGVTSPAQGFSANGGRERLFDALVNVIADQGENGPVVVVLDDLHLSPPSTRRMARRLASARLPILLIATVRTADPTVAEDLLDTAASDVVWLGGLGRAEIDEYLCQATGADRVGPDAVGWVADQTGGNPLLLRETARVLVNDRALDADRSFDPPGAVRDTSDALLLTRLEGLAVDTVATLQAAAVLGTRFLSEDLARLVTRADWHLGEARAVGLIVAGPEPGVMEFAHQLLHEAVYRMLSEDARLELHEAAAAVLAERIDGTEAPEDPFPMVDPIFQIARHHLVVAALDPFRAVGSLRAAADASLARFAYEDAALRFEEAVWVATHYAMGSDLCCELEIGRGDALRQAGDPQCMDVLLDAAGTADDLGAGDLMAAAALALCRLGPTSASGATNDRAAAVADRALVLVTNPGLSAELAGAASLLHSMGGEPERCLSLYDQAEKAARTLGDPEVLARVLPHAYLALGAPWFLNRRADLADEVSALADRIGDLSTGWEGCLLAYSALVERGDPAVYKVPPRAREISDVLREPTRQWETQWMEAGVAHLRGDLEGAERLIDASLDWAGAVAPSRVIATYGAQLLAIRIDQGRVGELVDELQGLTAEQPGVHAWRAALALSAAQSDRPALAIEQLASFWETGSLQLPGDFTWTAMTVVLARAATVVGTPSMHADLVDALAPYRGRLAWGGSCSYGPIDTALGMLLDAAGDRAGAEASFGRALVLADRLGATCFGAEAGQLLDGLRKAGSDRP